MVQSNWFSPLESIVSKGRLVKRPGSLAGLAEARQQHLGQFFTPREVANVMWQLAKLAMDRFDSEFPGEAKRFSIFDNSVGSGRLFQFADPERHKLNGVDVDHECINALSQHAEVAGFECDFHHVGMEAVKPRRMDVSIINPPFSVHIESPLLQPFPCTSYGKFGPNTSALTHVYALAQAIDVSQVVIALVPTTFAKEVLVNIEPFFGDEAKGKLHGIVHLPRGAFREEGTEVRVSILIFGPITRHEVIVHELLSLDAKIPVFRDLKLQTTPRSSSLKVLTMEDEGPWIRLPVTGNTDVILNHDGRKIKLQYHCGLTQAKVENAILRERIFSSSQNGIRLPKGIRYMGQGRLDIEVYLAQPDPEKAFAFLSDLIRFAGGNPVISMGLQNYWKRRRRHHCRAVEPFRHAVYMGDGSLGNGNRFVGKALATFAIDPTSWSSPVIKQGQEVELERDHQKFSCEIHNHRYLLESTEVEENFTIINGQAESGWTTVYEGLHETFPETSAALRQRANAAGLNQWLDWDFQLDDLIELTMKPRGAIAAWEMGLGKARLAIALLLLSGCKRGLIVTEAGLIDELLIELRKLPISPECWQVITTEAHLSMLRRINIISYERLRLPLKSARRSTSKDIRSHHTYAGKLRRRVGIVVCDEGDILANPLSDQSRATWQISAKRRYVLTGTPIANYPRDILPILAFTAGDGTAAQPWGWHRGKLNQTWLDSTEYAERGIDAFRNEFVSLEWVTREFEDTLVSGAKREIPRIRNVEVYRRMVAPHLKRRLEEEPDVKRWINIPKPTRSIVNIPWDRQHLSFYLKVCEDFRTWYSDSHGGSKRINLVAILAHLRAVSFAQDFPQYGVEGIGSFGPLTSKQRWLLDEIEALTQAGRKTVIYLENPGLVELLGIALRDRGIEFVPFHGGIPIKKRTRMLDECFRFGPVPNLVATLGVTQKGLNFPQANEAILGGRSWSASVEMQAVKRLLRPQQKDVVRIRYAHLPGGIDIYKAQLVDFKKHAASAGLDWGSSDCDEKEFLHLETIVARFVRDTAILYRLKPHELRAFLENMNQDTEILHAA